jgi:thioredoxin reductase (NADPH)
MSRYLVDRVEGTPNITVHTRRTVSAVEGEEEIAGISVRDADSGDETSLPVRALFLFIGAVPHTGWLQGCVELDRKGFVLTGNELPRPVLDGERWREVARPPFFLETSLPGVFAAGDVRSESVKRVASAVGGGSMTVHFVHAHIGAAV